MPKKYIQQTKNRLKIIEKENFDIMDEDVIYMAGLPAKDSDKNMREKYQITLEKIKSIKNNTLILNPLPRIDEISKEVDKLQNAKYFQQSKNGLFVRMAIFLKLLKDQSPS